MSNSLKLARLLLSAFLYLLVLFNAPTLAAQTLTRGPYLQQGDSDSIIVRWRTSSATDSVVHYGSSADALNAIASENTNTTEHTVQLTGLSPATRYYYTIGNSSQVLASGADYYFETSPIRGIASATRMWVIGDSGTANANAAAVYNAYLNHTGSTYTDLWLMLGDNAYNDGTEAQYQAAVFDMYPQLLRQTPLWPTLGNHDGYSADSASQSGPYYDIFTLPTQAEVGGVASGTEAYYAFDYANIHFIVLDSYETDRSATGAMMNWMKDDLQNVSADWLVAFWHHPPYTKGSHNSDIEAALIQMRQNFLPVLESYGVDLILSGHSHSYERSKFINGHYGFSSSYNDSHDIDAGSGRIDGSGAYQKDGTAANSGTVYAVAGASGKISGGSLNHPAMFVSLNQLGSMMIDINGDTLNAKYINNTGEITDYFTISKTTTPPTLPTAPTNLSAVASSSQSINIAWEDKSENEIGFDIERSLDNATWSLAGSVGMNTNTYNDLGLTPNTQYFYRVRAKNSAGISAYSNTAHTTTHIATPIITTTLQDGLNNYAGTQDAYIASGAGSSNWGHSEDLNADGADGGNGELVALVQWELSMLPCTASVTAAELTLEIFNTSPGAYNIFAVNSPWSESQVNWDNFAIAEAQGILLGTIFPSNTGKQTLSFNTAGIQRVQEWVLGLTPNYGFLIRSAGTGDGIDMRAREYAVIDQRPAFSITYETGTSSNAPTAPSNLQANTLSKEAIALQWTDNADNETRFNIERSIDGSTWALIDTTGTNKTSFSNAGLQADTTYFYRVSASNDAGTSTVSNTSSATTEPGEPEYTRIFQDGFENYRGTDDTYIASGAPTGNWGNAADLNADGDDGENGELVALLKWDISSLPTNAVISVVDINLEIFNTSPGEYKVYAMNGEWTETEVNWNSANLSTQQGNQIGMMYPSTSGSYTLGLNAEGLERVQQWVNGLTTNNGLLIRSAGTTDGVDLRSSEYNVSAQRPSLTLTYTLAAQTEIPQAPSNVAAYPLSGSAMDISWDHERTDDETTIELERSEDQAHWQMIASLHQDFDQFTDNGLSGNTQYFYRTRAVNSAGKSSYSNVASATTPSQSVTLHFQQGLEGYNGAADSTIASWRGRANYGGQTSLEADGWDGWKGELVGLLRWDLSSIPADAKITGATITLQITNNTNGSYGFFEMLADWNEYAVSWNSASVNDHQGAHAGSITPVDTGAATVNVNAAGLAFIQKWLDNPATNHGFVLRSMGTLDGIIANTKESPNMVERPKLTVTYEP
ncbi:Alkaline phosphatase [Thalassocella blandensis]|nr:Alkaline phosphatase [Thalassocella blandensis]